MRKLSKKEIEHILTIEDVNKKKDFIQLLVIQEFVKTVCGYGTFFTAFGKTIVIKKLITLFNTKKPDYTILIIVPSNDLEDDMQKLVKEFSLKNVTVRVVNTLANQVVKKGEQQYYDLVLADELHSLCGASSVYFSQVIPNLTWKYFCGLSATIEKDHAEYLENLGIPHFFDVPIETALKCKLIPNYNIWNIPVDFTFSEKMEYIDIQEKYQWYISKFSSHDPRNPTAAISSLLSPKKKLVKYNGNIKTSEEHAIDVGKSLGTDAGRCIGLAMKWRGVQSQRKAFFSRAKNSVTKTIEVVEYLEEQTLIFASSIENAILICSLLPNSKGYHSKINSKTREKNKLDFIEGRVKHLVAVNSLKQGMNKPDLKYIVRQGFTSKSGELIQQIGRTLRFNSEDLNKEAHLITVYVEDFEFQYKKYKSQQKVWLINSLKGKSFVEWVKNIQDIKI